MQFPSENCLNGSQISGRFGYFKAESELIFVFPRTPTSFIMHTYTLSLSLLVFLKHLSTLTKNNQLFIDTHDSPLNLVKDLLVTWHLQSGLDFPSTS